MITMRTAVPLLLVFCCGCIDLGLSKQSPDSDALVVAEGDSETFVIKLFPPDALDDLQWYLDGSPVQQGGSQFHYLAPLDALASQHRLIAQLPVQDGSEENTQNVQWRIADSIDVMPSADQNPHIPSGPGPWFEGWYTRLTDHENARSVAVIVASHLPKGEHYEPGRDYPGYVNILINEGDEHPTHSYTVFPPQTRVLVDGAPVASNPEPLAPAAFRWEADGIGYITEDSIHLNLSDAVRIDIETRNRIPFDRDNTNRVPEGPLALLPLPLRWYIHSFGSDASYEYQFLDNPAPSVSGSGFAHQEKNWGAQFPIGWIWGQGINTDNSAQFVASRALVDFKAFILDAWIVAFRNKDLAWDFRFDEADVELSDDIDACAANAVLDIRDKSRRLVLDFSAPFDSFGDVSIPTEDGFQPASGGESFAATVTVTAYEQGVQVAEEHFSHAVLELGASFFCDTAPP